MSGSDGGTLRVSVMDVEEEIARRPPPPEPSLSVILYRVFQFNSLANEPYSPAHRDVARAPGYDGR